MMDEAWKNLVKKYISTGIVKGGELLLCPEDAIGFLHDLVEIRVRVIGCDCWRYLDPQQKDRKRIVQIVGGGCGAKNPFELTMDENARIVDNYLNNELEDDVDLVSLLIEDFEKFGKYSHLFYDFIKSFRSE